MCRTAFRGNEYSAEGIEHRARQDRMQLEQINQLTSYANKTKLASATEQSKRRMKNVRERNMLFKQAAHMSMAHAAQQENEYERGLQKLAMDEALAVEVSKRTVDKRARERVIQRICEDDPTLRNLQARLKAAYMNKDRAAQLDEKKRLDEQERQREEQVAADMERARIEGARKQAARDEARANAQRAGASSIKGQMLYKQNQQREEAYREYLKDRTEIERLVQDIQQEQQREVDLVNKKRSELRTDMLQCLTDRQQQLEDRRQEEADQLSRINAYKAKVYKRGMKEAERKAQLEAEQGRIRAKLEADAEAKRQEEERVHNALELLRKEDADRRREKAEQDRKDRLERMKQDMMAANEAQKLFKKEQKVLDMAAEKVLVGKMMAKFAADEQLEKNKEAARLERRDEYKAGMEHQMKQRQQMYELAKQTDAVERQKALEKEEFRRRVVEEARQRLIAQHAANLKEFLPKGVLTSEEDLRLLNANIGSGAGGNAKTLMQYGDTAADAQQEERDREVAFARLQADQAETKRKLQAQHHKKTQLW